MSWRRLTLLIFGFCAGLAVIGLVEAKPLPERIVLKQCKKKKKPVKFNHKAHMELSKKEPKKCMSCHHKGSKTKGPKPGKTCASCHKKKTKKTDTCFKMSKTKNPFHIRCVGCHKKMKAKFPKAATKCTGCHR